MDAVASRTGTVISLSCVCLCWFMCLFVTLFAVRTAVDSLVLGN